LDLFKDRDPPAENVAALGQVSDSFIFRRIEVLVNPHIKETMKKITIVFWVLVAISGNVNADSRQNISATTRPDYQLTNTGTVLEVIDSEMYTYLQVSGETGAIWLAAYKNDIVRGDTVRYSKGVVMRNFQSQSIKRTFDTIIFVDSVIAIKK
jgi:hypothetical protein